MLIVQLYPSIDHGNMQYIVRYATLRLRVVLSSPSRYSITPILEYVQHITERMSWTLFEGRRRLAPPLSSSETRKSSGRLDLIVVGLNSQLMNSLFIGQCSRCDMPSGPCEGMGTIHVL